MMADRKLASKKLPPTRQQQPIVFQRADPVELQRFDPQTKRCTMYCGPHVDDPRSAAERAFLCDDCVTVAAMTKRLRIYKYEGDKLYSREGNIGRCPHCNGFELIVSEVERQGYPPEQFPSAVHCGDCGASGPWGDTEESALAAWNRTARVHTGFTTAWQRVLTSEPSDDLPF
jgi:hypothetical protein